MATTFTYYPLGPGEIRLLKARTRSNEKTELAFDVTHVKLSSQPKYTALSYTWGKKGNTHRIWLSGHVFPIRRNLHEALSQIEASKLVDEYLWIDAICINQADGAMAERSGQIRLAKNIYEQAAMVLVWLGTPQSQINNQLACRKLDEFERKYRAIATAQQPYRPWWWKRKDPPRTVQMNTVDFQLTVAPDDKSVIDVPGSNTHKAWLGIGAMLKSDWWNRTWVFQESTVGEQNVTLYWSGFEVYRPKARVKFVYGDQTTNWNQLMAMYHLVQALPRRDEINFIKDAMQGLTVMHRLYHLRVNKLAISFLQALQLTRISSCYDPRDKVWAPLCLSPDSVRKLMVPDLKKTSLEVYLDVVRLCLGTASPNLDFLGYAMYHDVPRPPRPEPPPEEAGIAICPTWLPDWDRQFDMRPIPKILFVPEDYQKSHRGFIDRRGFVTDTGPKIDAYDVLSDIPCDARIVNLQLHLTGVFCDVVEDVIPVTGPDVETVAYNKGFKWGKESGGRYPTGQKYMDAYRETMAMGLTYDQHFRPSERGGSVEHKFLQKPRSELSQVDYGYQKRMREASTNAQSFRNTARSDKKYLMKVPRWTQVGDEVWALAGGRVLYVLRTVDKAKRQFMYLGEAYVHGLMDGEVSRRLLVGEATITKVILV